LVSGRRDEKIQANNGVLLLFFLFGLFLSFRFLKTTINLSLSLAGVSSAGEYFA
jgi:hypothetical protein